MSHDQNKQRDLQQSPLAIAFLPHRKERSHQKSLNGVDREALGVPPLLVISLDRAYAGSLVAPPKRNAVATEIKVNDLQ